MDRFIRDLFLLALSFLLAACVEAAPEPLAVNLGFEQWDDSRTQAIGWQAGDTRGYRTAADCNNATEGACALQIESLPGRSQTQSAVLAQVIPVSAVGGHALVLTGMLRTENVRTGFAALWMRVDASRGPALEFDNMADRGPRGTTAWQRFRVVLPVAPNAKQVVVGVLLTGTGKVWFDDLSVETDTTVDVAEVTPAQVAHPPRPVPSSQLADESEMALPEAAMAAIDPAIRSDVRAHSHPVRSLVSDDFADLQFLKTVLAGKRVVALGESAHGVAEFNWMKVRLVKFLHQQMGFDVIAFESSLSECSVADSEIAMQPPGQVMTDCIFATWWTSEVLPLFDYLEVARKGGKPMILAGFDSQKSGNAQSRVAQRLANLVAELDPQLAQRVGDDEATIARWYSTFGGKAVDPADTQRLLNDYAYAEQLSRDHRPDLERQPGVTAALVDIAIQEFHSRQALVRQLTASGSEGSAIRDRAMADNLDFLLDRRFPGKKVMVWAHNYHIAKSHFGDEVPRTMGAWAAQRRGAEVYALGLYMGRGVAATNKRELYTIAAPAPFSLDAIMASAGLTMSFLDLSGVDGTDVPTWAQHAVSARDWGTEPVTIVPAQAYEGLLYIDSVTPPDYMRAEDAKSAAPSH